MKDISKEELKEKFTKNSALTSNPELLELLLSFVMPRKDVKPIADNILFKTQSFLNIFNSDLSDIDGVGKQTNIFFTAMKELFDRCKKEIAISSMDLNSAEAIYYFFKYSISLGKKENFAVVFLNDQNKLIHYEIISKGTINATVVFPRELAELALKYKAVNVIVVHNHPSGNLVPSDGDVTMTNKIKNALATFDINLVDHIIISKKGYTSITKLGLL